MTYQNHGGAGTWFRAGQLESAPPYVVQNRVPADPALSEEICDGLDNDHNGQIDDVLVTGQIATDPRNCGRCGNSCAGVFANSEAVCVGGTCGLACLDGYFDLDPGVNGCEFSCFDCTFPHANSDYGRCLETGQCAMSECQPGYTDRDHDSGDGCEYACTESPPDASGHGAEICDGRDNDCNGIVDDSPAVLADPRNCGSCGHNCADEVANAVAACKNGRCLVAHCLDGYFDQDGDPNNGCERPCVGECRFPFAYAHCDDQGDCTMGDCFPDYHDLDSKVAGCEYFCQPTFPPTEICDGQDNDCNGKVDDVARTLLRSDPENCGGCGRSCTGRFANSEPACSGGLCVLGPCLAGFFDHDRDPSNGCESRGEPGPPWGASHEQPASGQATQYATSGQRAADRLADWHQAAPQEETCNQQDDDRNGIVDDIPPSSCGRSSFGACRLGMTCCRNGLTECIGNIDPVPEVCDAYGAIAPQFDNNCDDRIDEGCLEVRGAPVRLTSDELGVVPVSATRSLRPAFQLAAASSDNLYFVAYAASRDGATHLFGTYSLDGGLNWPAVSSGAADLRIAHATELAASQEEPNVFLRPGRVYVAYSRWSGPLRQIYLSVASAGASYPHFSSWSVGRRLDTRCGSRQVGCFTPQGVVAQQDPSGISDFLVVTWNEIGLAAATSTRNIYLRYTKNGSTGEWTGTVALPVNTLQGGANCIPNDRGELPVTNTDGAGMVYLAWRDHSMGSARVFFRRLDLNAAHPKLEAAWALQPDTTAHDVAADDLRMAADSSGNVHVAWTSLSDHTIRVASATNCGKGTTLAQCQSSFTKMGPHIDGLVVSPDNLGSPVAKPTIAARAGKVVVAWEDTRSGASDIRANRARHTGGTWNWLSSSQRVDAGDPLGATASMDPMVAFGQATGPEATVLVTWVDARDPRTAVYANLSLDSGTTFFNGARAHALRMDSTPAGSFSPLVLGMAHANRASVVWVDSVAAAEDKGGYGRIYADLLQ